MLPMIPPRPSEYEDELSALEAALASLETQVSTVNDTIAALQLTANNTNTVNVSGGGNSIFSQRVLDGEIITIANNLDYVSGSCILRKVSDGQYYSQNFSGGVGNILAAWVGLEIGLLANGDFYVNSTSYDFDVQISFTSSPLMAGGIVGPQGATGPAGADGEIIKTAWQNVSFAANWSNYGGIHQIAQYRLFDDVVQIRGMVTCSATWASNQFVFTLPAGYRPPAENIFIVQAAGGTKRLMIQTGGGVQLSTSDGSSTQTTGWISLPTIQFSIS